MRSKVLAIRDNTMLDNVYFDIGSLHRHQGQPPSPHTLVKTTPSPRPAQSTATHASELQLGCYHLGATGVGQLGRCYHGARLDPWRLEELCFLF